MISLWTALDTFAEHCKTKNISFIGFQTIKNDIYPKYNFLFSNFENYNKIMTNPLSLLYEDYIYFMKKLKKVKVKVKEVGEFIK